MNGIYVPLITPFDENGEVDYRGLAKATRFVLEKGADGIYACGGTSEFCLLSIDERKRCLEVILENAGEAKVIAHVGSCANRHAIDLAVHASQAGAVMLSAVSPYYFDYGFKQIKEYFDEIAQATDLPLMIYSASQARSYTLDEMSSILQNEKIIAVKYTGKDFYFLERLIYLFPNKKFFTGCDEMFLPGQSIGAHGAIGATFNTFADQYIKIKKLFADGKNTEALKLFNKINTFTQAYIDSGALMPAIKYVMGLQGLDIAVDSRKPFASLSEESERRLKILFENVAF